MTQRGVDAALRGIARLSKQLLCSKKSGSSESSGTIRGNRALSRPFNETYRKWIRNLA